MRVLVTGGGTGGHVNPALAIANTIKKNIPDAEIAFVGTVRGLENQLVPKAGYKLYHVDVRGIRRSLSLYNIRSLWLAAVSPVKAKKIIKEFKPDLVVGTGGYVSWPILVAASRMNIPTAVHESNAVPGLAVRKLVPYVDRIFTNFAVSAEILGKSGKVMQVGCPMLGEFGNISREDARKQLGIPLNSKYIVSFGGSLGAAAMNDMAIELMRDYVSANKNVKYTHATGGDHFESVNERFLGEELDKYENIELLQYIYDMPLRMAAADIIISRAGAITISELARQGKAAILIPSPNVTDDQQTKNAKALADIGGACMIREPELVNGKICKEVASLLEDGARRAAMEKAIAGFAPLDSNKLIFDELIRLSKSKK
ncbi:MAG: undecaprenyldiphospho-muramoylpentapeptide beta-N-acetylglucosaminyltransferase [Clostridia bacterium]|nr:undecaprenyldiphospho-muramoylpentapeptide beta-N-acetylglucosaminyltransferase [Clostridia bacterium]